MRGPTATQKRAVAGLADPLLRLAFFFYRRLLGSPALHLSPDIETAQIKKILAVRLDAIGDLLLTEPALALLRQRFPQARIDLVANPGSAVVLRGNPNVDRVIAYRAPWHASWRGAKVDWKKEFSGFWRLASELRYERYDVGLELRGDIRDILFLAAAAPGTVIGNSFRGGGGLLDWDILLSPDAHQVELAATIATWGKPPAAVPAPRLYLSDADRRAAEKLLPQEPGVTIALHLGAGFPSKCLPLERFIEVATALWKRDPRRRFLIVGGPEELSLSQAFGASVPFEPVDVAGQLSLLETAAVLGRCQLFLGNDSAPMHLAAAVGTPVVTFFGPSEPWKFHPYGVPYRLLEVQDLECRPCDYVHCIWAGNLRYQCMTRQSTEAIVQAAEELLAAPKPQTSYLTGERADATLRQTRSRVESE